MTLDEIKINNTGKGYADDVQARIEEIKSLLRRAQEKKKDRQLILRDMRAGTHRIPDEDEVRPAAASETSSCYTSSLSMDIARPSQIGPHSFMSRREVA